METSPTPPMSAAAVHRAAVVPNSGVSTVARAMDPSRRSRMVKSRRLNTRPRWRRSVPSWTSVSVSTNAGAMHAPIRKLAIANTA